MRKLLTRIAMLSLAPAMLQAAIVDPAPAILVLEAPGYVQLDGRWYDYEASAGQLIGIGARLLAQPTRDGFFLDSFISARDCQRRSGGAISADGLLQHAETLVGDPDGAIPLYRRTGPVQVLASVVVRSCLDATPVLQLASAHGDLVCAGEIAAPFTAEECPPRSDPLIIFGDGFTPPEP